MATDNMTYGQVDEALGSSSAAIKLCAVFDKHSRTLCPFYVAYRSYVTTRRHAIDNADSMKTTDNAQYNNRQHSAGMATPAQRHATACLRFMMQHNGNYSHSFP